MLHWERGSAARIGESDEVEEGGLEDNAIRRVGTLSPVISDGKVPKRASPEARKIS